VSTIGDSAGHGRVPTRMLRHHGAIGPLRPVRADPVSGHRFHEAAGPSGSTASSP